MYTTGSIHPWYLYILEEISSISEIEHLVGEPEIQKLEKVAGK